MPTHGFECRHDAAWRKGSLGAVAVAQWLARLLSHASYASLSFGRASAAPGPPCASARTCCV